MEYFRDSVENIEHLRLPKKFLDDFFSYAKVCKTRPRIVGTYAKEPELQKCYSDALETSGETGYRLFSGFVYHKSGGVIWHCFNVDPQGYVFDSYPFGNSLNLEGVYFGVEHSAYLQQLEGAFRDKKKYPDFDFEGAFIAYFDSVLLQKDAKEQFDTLVGEFIARNPDTGLSTGFLIPAVNLAYILPDVENNKNSIMKHYTLDEESYEIVCRMGLLLSKVSD